MKTLRAFILIAILIIGGMAMTSCENDNTSNNPETATTDGETESQAVAIPIYYNEESHILDSIKVLASQVESLLKTQETNSTNIQEMSNEISDLKGTSHLYDFISWVIATIALLFSVIALIKLNSAQKLANKHRRDIEKVVSMISSLEQKNNTTSVRTKTANPGLSHNEYTTLTSRIYKIERQLAKIETSHIHAQDHISPCNPVSSERYLVNEQFGYFGLPTQMSLTEAYFKRLSDIRESDSRFTVEVRNDKAEFRPLEGNQYLNDLKSNDSIKMALNIQGCAPSEATQMKVIDPGEAKKDGERWIITKKAIIALY